MAPLAGTSTQKDHCGRNQAGTIFWVTSCLLFCISTIVVPLRLWVRLKFQEPFFGVDDVCLVIAYIFAVPTAVLLWRMSIVALGRHTRCSSDHDLIETLKFEWIAQTLLIISTMFSRASVALFVTRLFGVTKRMRKTLHAYTAFMCISITITAVLIWAQCTPVEAKWNYHLLSEAKCWPRPGVYFVDYYNSAVSILSDFLLAMLPSYFLSKLQMSRELKISLMVLMAIGLVPMICAICRTIFVSVQVTAVDPLYQLPQLFIFGSTEALFLIICASVTALMPLFRSAKVKISQIKSSLFASPSISSGKSPWSDPIESSEEKTRRVEVTCTWSVHHTPKSSLDDEMADQVLGGLSTGSSSIV